MPAVLAPGFLLPPDLLATLQQIADRCGHDVLVERVCGGAAVIRLAGMTNFFAYGTLKYGLNGSSDVLAASDFGSMSSRRDPMPVFCLYTAQHELVVVSGRASRVMWSVMAQDQATMRKTGAIVAADFNYWVGGGCAPYIWTIAPPRGRILSGSNQAFQQRETLGFERTFLDQMATFTTRVPLFAAV